MKAEKNKVVSVSYELKLSEKDNDIIDSANENKPLEFLFGSGMMLQKFEDNLSGLTTNDTFKFKLTSEEGYGTRNDDYVSDVPLDIFKKDGKIEDDLLAVGNVIPMQDENGNHFNGQVISVENEMVKLDFNHPLAGENLYFTGKIVGLREATEIELQHGHVHGHGHHHGHDHDDPNHKCSC